MSSSPWEQTLQRLLDLLERLRRLRRGRSGVPALTRLDAAAGHSRGHLRRQLKGEIRMSAGDLFRAFELLGAGPEEHLAAARRGRTPLELWLGETAREDRWQLRALRAPRRTPAPGDLDAALRRLDELLRLGQPEAAETGPYLAALAALEEQGGAEAEDLRFRTWDLLGAAYRFAARYSASAHCYLQALRLTAGHPLKRARILRRGCYLATDQCDFDDALYFADQAGEIYLRQHRLPDVGRAWIDSAITLDKCGCGGGAVPRFEAGLSLLDEDVFYRFSGLQSLSLCHVYLGNLDEARVLLERAQQLEMHRGPRQLDGLHWIAAEIALLEDGFLTARVLFERIRYIRSKASDPFQLAAVNLRLAKALVKLADLDALDEVSTRTTQLMTPLKRHPFALATLTDFHRLSFERKLSGKHLDRLYFDLVKRGRATRRAPPSG